MKESIFTNPIFINPQAYLIIPELTTISKCIPFDLTTSNIYTFKINTNGKIEGKLLNNGNNSILHLDYYGVLGNAVLGEFIIDIDYNASKDLFNLSQVGNLITIQFDDGNIHYPGLIAAWSDEGKTNEDKDRDVLRDLTGNGHDIQLYNVAFSGMSGHGGYNLNFSKDSNSGSQWEFISNYKGIVFKGFNQINIRKYVAWGDTLNIKVRFSNISSNYPFKVLAYDKDSVYNVFNKEIISDGIYDIEITSNANTDVTNKDIYSIRFLNQQNSDTDVTVELLPEYPGALVLDGVNDYGICDNMPITTDYTIIAKRILFSDNNSGPVLSKLKTMGSGAFYIEGDLTHDNINSFGLNNKVIYNNSKITFITKNSYNGQLINNGSNKDSDSIFLGRVRKDYGGTWKGAFYSAYLFDRSLDEQEIKSFIRKYIDPEYLLPSEIPTPDCYYDFSLGSNDDANREVVKDQSGNGNDAKIYNCAFNENGSGYKDGALVLDGVDDYIRLETFDSEFKTVFMLCNPIKIGTGLYDQTTNFNNNNFIIFNSSNTIAYVFKNPNYSVNMINGVKNSIIKTDSLINKKHLIVSGNEDVTETISPAIGKSFRGYFANMAIYKFLGFKEALNEDQIKAVIQKYNLLDGVDDIEVSQNN